MGNTQSEINDLRRELSNVSSDRNKERDRLLKKIEDKEVEWTVSFEREISENARLQQELTNEQYCRINELELVKADIEKERRKYEKREQLRRQEEKKKETEYETNLERIRREAEHHIEFTRTLHANHQRETSLVQEERDIEKQRIQEARLDKDKEKELKHQQKLDEINKRADQQSKDAQAALNTAEHNRIRIEEEQTTIEEDRIKTLRRKEEEERKKREKEEEKERQEIRHQQILDIRKELHFLKPGDSFEYRPQNVTFPEKYNIGLFGTTGIGKSSLLNSLKFAFKGELTELTREQTSTDQFHGGHTVRRLKVPVTPHLTFIDNRGVGAEDLDNINGEEEIISQLEGRASLSKQVDWRNSDGAKGRKVKAENRIHCSILVFDAQNPQAVHAVLPKLVKEIVRWQGRFPIGVLTRVDKSTPKQLENMYVVTKAAGIVDTFEIANITDKRTELSREHELALLKLMRLCIKQGDQVFKLREEIEREEAEEREEVEENARKLKQEEKEMIAVTREKEKNATEVEEVKMMREVEEERMVMKASKERVDKKVKRAKVGPEIEETVKAKREKEKLKVIRENEEVRGVKKEGENAEMTKKEENNNIRIAKGEEKRKTKVKEVKEPTSERPQMRRKNEEAMEDELKLIREGKERRVTESQIDNNQSKQSDVNKVKDLVNKFEKM